MKKTFGTMVASLRKERGMTQSELAEEMGVTDKAVSKWERDLSFPDVTTLPRLAGIFNVTVDELMQAKTDGAPGRKKPVELVPLILRAVSLAMGVAVVVLSAMGDAEPNAAVSMLGLGLACLALAQFSEKR